jgi:outer membrane protein assembly factor BamB
LLYTTCGTQFVALQKTDGSQSWVLPDFQTQGASVIPNAPLMLPNGTFLFDKDEHTVATDRSGTTLWTYPLDSGDGARLVGAAGRSVFAVDLMKGFTVLDASDGSVRWTFNGEPVVGFDSPPAIAADGTIYAVGARGPLFAFAPDGSLNWKFLLPEKTTTGHGYAPPLVGSDGTIYLLLEQAVIAVSSQGKLVWEQKLPGPAIDLGFLLLAADGTLYVVTDTAMVHAVQTASHGPLQNSGGRF